MGKLAGIIQSNYVPWKGYFDFIASVDEFIIFDDVQYTRRDWRNRNLIKTKDGLQWITVPVDVKGKYLQSIAETRISNASWVAEHLAKIHHAYARAPYYETEREWVRDAFETAGRCEMLSEANVVLIRAICARLGIATPIRMSSEYDMVDGKNERLIALCRQAGADRYLSGPAAQSYIDAAMWSDAGIAVAYKSYAGYPVYPQLHGDFEHGVTVLDLLFNAGPEAAALYRNTTAHANV